MAGAGVFPKSDGDIIYQADYNAIQTVIAGVVNTYYGNAISSVQITGNPIIRAWHLDDLRTDINKAYKHITGSNSTITDVSVGDTITNEVWNDYKTAADYCETNKATVYAATQLATSVDSDSMTVPWNGSHKWEVQYSWSTAQQADYFFNAGGKFVIDVSGANSSGSSKDDDWQNNILNAIPTQTYAKSNWDSSVDIDVYEYGNVTQYTENYCRIQVTRAGSTIIVRVFVNDADTGDQTGIGPAVDENVTTDVNASITMYYSVDAITVNNPTPTTLDTFGSVTIVTVSADVLVVAGGGAGGSGWPDNIGGGGGGGGGGGVNTGTVTLEQGQTYTVTVGAGGTNIPYPTGGAGGTGGSSSFLGISATGGNGGITLGGGYGGYGGGSGGPNGSSGGAAYANGGSSGLGGGGGSGGVDDQNNSTVGGDGYVWSISGETFAGGGGGGGDYSYGAAGGAGGGGHGGSGLDAVTQGTDGPGGGGGGGSSTGGGSWGAGADGGDGVVIISYVNATQLFTGGSSTYNVGTRWFHRYELSGTWSLS